MVPRADKEAVPTDSLPQDFSTESLRRRLRYTITILTRRATLISVS